MELSHSRGLAEFSEIDLQDNTIVIALWKCNCHCKYLLNAGMTLSFISEERSGTERAREQSSDSETHYISTS